MLKRDERRALRRRGRGNRITDLNGFNIQEPSASQVPPMLLEEANKSIIQKHNEMTGLRRRIRLRDRKEAQEAFKRRRTLGNHTRVMSGAIGVKIKYKRVPQNRAKLIGLDVISEIIIDYFKSNELATMIGRKLVEKSKPKDKPIIRNQTRTLFKDYIQRITSYFTNLIDLRLSNQLLINDLQSVNREKDIVRSEVFALRDEQNQIANELQQLRESFNLMRQEYETSVSLMKKFDNIFEGPNGQGSRNLIEQVQWKLKKLNNGIPVKLQNNMDNNNRSDLLLQKLKLFNDKLEKLSTN